MGDFRFADVDPEAFPFTIYLTETETGKLWRVYEVPSPGLIEFKGTGGDPPVDVTIIWGDGQVMVKGGETDD